MEKTDENKLDNSQNHRMISKNLNIIYLATTKDNINHNINTLLMETISYIRNEDKIYKDDFFIDFNGIRKNQMFSCDDVDKGKIKMNNNKKLLKFLEQQKIIQKFILKVSKY